MKLTIHSNRFKKVPQPAKQIRISEVKTSLEWIEHFNNNAKQQRIDWRIAPTITLSEKKQLVKSLQAWQLGETSDGCHLLKAATSYSKRIMDPYYPEAVKLFIKEEQKHGNNLGAYLDLIAIPRLKKNWGDTLFRKVRYFNSSMELWTIAVIIVESCAQLFYKSVKDGTQCGLLKSICTDILQDEAPHVVFQAERLMLIFHDKNRFEKFICKNFYFFSFYTIILTVWLGHHQAFQAGGNDFKTYWRRMNYKFKKIINRLN